MQVVVTTYLAIADKHHRALKVCLGLYKRADLCHAAIRVTRHLVSYYLVKSTCVSACAESKSSLSEMAHMRQVPEHDALRALHSQSLSLFSAISHQWRYLQLGHEAKLGFLEASHSQLVMCLSWCSPCCQGCTLCR